MEHIFYNKGDAILDSVEILVGLWQENCLFMLLLQRRAVPALYDKSDAGKAGQNAARLLEREIPLLLAGAK